MKESRLGDGAARARGQDADDYQDEAGIHRGFEEQVELAVIEVERHAQECEEVAEVAVDEDDARADEEPDEGDDERVVLASPSLAADETCLLYTSDAADDMQCVDLGGRRIIKKK